MLTHDLVVVAPATGTPETGGWSTRELRTILRGLDGINLIAADIVEVAVSLRPGFSRRTDCGTWEWCANIEVFFVVVSQPAYDTNAEHTTMAAADALYEIMSIMLKRGPLSLDEEAGQGEL